MRSIAIATSLLILLALSSTGAGAATPTREQQRCLVELNRAGVRVAELTTRELLRCARAASRGRLPAGQSIEQCVQADASRRIENARITAHVAEARWCTGPAPLGPTGADAVNQILSELDQVPALLGPDAAATLVAGRDEPGGAQCQLAAVRGLGRVAVAKLREFNRCAESGLAAGTVASAAELEACIGADPRGRVARIVASVGVRAERACRGRPIATLLPGACAGAGAAEIGACIEPRVHCDVCRGLNDAERVGASCHRFAEGEALAYCGERPAREHSVARLWDEELLESIRLDTPRPTVHARNLWHLSVAMWDAWAAYDDTADMFLHASRATADDVAGARDTTISFAAYRLLRHRFASSPGAAAALASYDALFYELGYDASFTSTGGGTPAALGNQIAAEVIAYGLADGSRESTDYDDPTYTPLNEPMVVKDPGTVMAEPSHWQPLALEVQIGQNGVPIPGKVQQFVGPNWGDVLPFALERAVPGQPYFDPIPPPAIEDPATNAEFKDSAVEVILKQSLLNPTDDTLMDASPGAIGNNTLGTDDGTGRPLNPFTGLPYAPNIVKRQDFFRSLGMFWADGPHSETPPGHWNVLANEVGDHPGFEKRLGGVGPVLDDLEWDVKIYFALNGATHDAAIAAWEQKRLYDSVRPISMIRYMGGLGQSSDPGGPSYHENGLPLVPGLIEVITAETSAPGERHEHLAEFVGEIAVIGWMGEPANPRTEIGGTGWIRAKLWIAFQRNTFVSPAFAGFVSGHSTFSRTSAEIMTLFTGDAYFPGGLGEFVAPADVFLPPEKGPTQDTPLQWATYYDAADQAGISRLWSGIHVRADDFEGRKIGSEIGVNAYARALTYFAGTAAP